jgi:hypothetical protein
VLHRDPSTGPRLSSQAARRACPRPCDFDTERKPLVETAAKPRLESLKQDGLRLDIGLLPAFLEKSVNAPVPNYIRVGNGNPTLIPGFKRPVNSGSKMLCPLRNPWRTPWASTLEPMTGY